MNHTPEETTVYTDHVLLTVVGHYIGDENVEELCEISEEIPIGILDIAEGVMQYFADQRKAFLTVNSTPRRHMNFLVNLLHEY